LIDADRNSRQAQPDLRGSKPIVVTVLNVINALLAEAADDVVVAAEMEGQPFLVFAAHQDFVVPHAVVLNLTLIDQGKNLWFRQAGDIPGEGMVDQVPAAAGIVTHAA